MSKSTAGYIGKRLVRFWLYLAAVSVMAFFLVSLSQIGRASCRERV